MQLLIILAIAVAVLIVAYFAMSYYMSRPSVCVEDSLMKQIFIFAQGACKPSEIQKFVAQSLSEINQTKEGKELLEKETDKQRLNHLAIFYFDGPRLVEKYGKCRVCAGILCNKDAKTEGLEEQLKSKGYVTTVIQFTKGVSRKVPNTKGLNPSYVPGGLAAYPCIESYIKGNSDTSESLTESPGYKEGEIQLAEIVDPKTVTYYRPLFHPERLLVTRLPSLKEQGTKKDN
eukprot:TRINITY_DN7952_c0_g1_i3.p1 TRINITY_DN7952_c0_g1~~TRINITY_DN7952_c0_g1_i3.p1  ORF type:complete len:231 (+),score=59.59 TRINITY_DN7952_c0_g1_i3:107-799(+)